MNEWDFILFILGIGLILLVLFGFFNNVEWRTIEEKFCSDQKKQTNCVVLHNETYCSVEEPTYVFASKFSYCDGKPFICERVSRQCDFVKGVDLVEEND